MCESLTEGRTNQ